MGMVACLRFYCQRSFHYVVLPINYNVLRWRQKSNSAPSFTKNRNQAMKILLFCWGDPTQATTWSNVPFCLSKGLEANGHNVVGYNLNSHPSLSDFWDNHILRYLRKFFKNCQYGFLRTPFAQYFANQIVRNAINQNKDADVCLFTTFSFCNRNKKLPSILFCDWSYESYLNRINHKPFFFEKWFIKHESKCLRTASACVSLFPEATEKINNQLGRKIVSWGG